MKSRFRGFIECLSKFPPVKYFFRLFVRALRIAFQFFGFFYVRSIVDLPSGSNCHWSTQFKFPENITFSGPVMISPSCVIGAMASVSLGRQVRISQGVHIETASLDLKSGLPYRHIAKPIIIKDGVWIGAHSIILGGVEIGANAVIGAGVVVSKSVPPGAIVVGKGNRFI